MHKKMHNPRYTKLDLLKEALYKTILIGFFIVFYINMMHNGFEGLSL